MFQAWGIDQFSKSGGLTNKLWIFVIQNMVKATGEG